MRLYERDEAQRNWLEGYKAGKAEAQAGKAEAEADRDRLRAERDHFEASRDRCDHMLARTQAERDRYREAAEVFAHYYDALCDELKGTDMAWLCARGVLNERYLAARRTLNVADTANLKEER